MVKNRVKEHSLILIITYTKANFSIIRSTAMEYMNSMAENIKDSLSMGNLMEREV
jgi:hypothetical protein